MSDELVRIADQMEGLEPDDPMLKELRKDYKAVLDATIPKSKRPNIGFSSSVIKASRKKALSEIVTILDKGNVDDQFKDRNGNYHSAEKFIVIWSGNWNGIPSEFGLDLTDSFYASVVGPKCIYATRSLVHEKQLASYHNIEYGLLSIGIKLCSNRKKKKEFFEKYGAPYNARIKKKTKKSE